MSFRPTDVLTSDAYISPESLYLGRDSSGNYFTGKVDDIRVYNVAETAAEVVNEMARSGPRIGEFDATSIMTFNGTSTTAESGVHDGATRTLQAWVNPSVATPSYEAILDAYDERGSGNNRGTGFGITNNVIMVRTQRCGPMEYRHFRNAQHLAADRRDDQRRHRAAVCQRRPACHAHVYPGRCPGQKLSHRFLPDRHQQPAHAAPAFFNGQLYDVRVYSAVVAPNGKLDKPPVATNDTVTANPGPNTISGFGQ